MSAHPTRRPTSSTNPSTFPQKHNYVTIIFSSPCRVRAVQDHYYHINYVCAPNTPPPPSLLLSTNPLHGRWANVLSDYSRQTVVECFLGLRLNDHFPSLTLPYQGDGNLPLGEPEDDEADLENSPPSTLKDKARLTTPPTIHFAARLTPPPSV